MLPPNTDSATAKTHSPVPPCRCDACLEATRQADVQRFAILNVVAQFEAIDDLFDQLTRCEYRAERAGRVTR
jgi:hypothetical protein